MRSEKIMNAKEDSVKKSITAVVNYNRVGSAELIIDSNAGFLEGLTTFIRGVYWNKCVIQRKQHL